jgi:transcriptional regulator with XRE-family HTH domain
MVGENRTLGSLIRLLRRQKGWTLRKMSEHVGIPSSTLSKVEADKLTLTYNKLQQFTSRLGLSLPEFLGQSVMTSAKSPQNLFTARRSVTGKGNSVFVSALNYEYQYLCADLKQKRMVPLLTRVHAHTIEQLGELVFHTGEEFIYVIEGAIEVHLQFYTSAVLTAGQGIYLDSTMGHAYLAKDCESALVLEVCSSEDANLPNELITLAESSAAQRP